VTSNQESPVPTFKAYRTFEENGKVTSRFVDMKLDELDPGNVVVRTKYSTINYKDALSHNGTGRIMRKFPTVAGIDMSGTVEVSSGPDSPRVPAPSDGSQDFIQSDGPFGSNPTGYED
jgi:NADPH:quinone reductase-like Zn-dependent oxidoreductase